MTFVSAKAPEGPAERVSSVSANPPEGRAGRMSTVPFEPPPRLKRVLVAGVGNVLRGDDGFGPAVTERLGHLPEGADVVETGIGGIALLQELMAGCDALILIDAVDRGAEPGTVFLITPEVLEGVHVPDVHLANPDRVLSMAKTMGFLPDRVLIVGCQPADMDELGAGLSPAVERAVALAVTKIEEAVDGWL
ncbi:MAG: hydrogenase maturation protease [Solirubrobacteraceae bacterium]|nr:hydrogenase maturation protease [Solirubrobacteraceae bacterium]